jgi:hypothetical protein
MGFFGLAKPNPTETDWVIGLPPLKPLVRLALAFIRALLNSSLALLLVNPA